MKGNFRKEGRTRGRVQGGRVGVAEGRTARRQNGGIGRNSKKPTKMVMTGKN